MTISMEILRVALQVAMRMLFRGHEASVVENMFLKNHGENFQRGSYERSKRI